MRLNNSSFKRNLHTNLTASVILISAMLIGAVVFIHIWKQAPIGNLTRDFAVIGELPIYTGMLSQVGLFFWSATTAICFFSTTLLPQKISLCRFRYFLMASGFMTLSLGLDDAFLLHEDVMPKLGFPEKLVLAIYVVLMIIGFLKFYPLIIETDFIFLGASLLFFSASITVDFLTSVEADILFLLEDGAKFMGIVCWFIYFFSVGQFAVRLRDAHLK